MEASGPFKNKSWKHTSTYTAYTVQCLKKEANLGVKLCWENGGTYLLHVHEKRVLKTTDKCGAIQKKKCFKPYLPNICCFFLITYLTKERGGATPIKFLQECFYAAVFGTYV